MRHSKFLQQVMAEGLTWRSCNEHREKMTFKGRKQMLSFQTYCALMGGWQLIYCEGRMSLCSSLIRFALHIQKYSCGTLFTLLPSPLCFHTLSVCGMETSRHAPLYASVFWSHLCHCPLVGQIQYFSRGFSLQSSKIRGMQGSRRCLLT